jgi:hypothetical protein
LKLDRIIQSLHRKPGSPGFLFGVETMAADYATA